MIHNEDDKLPDSLRNAARDYNRPPELERPDHDAMWSAIESDAFPKRFSTPSVELRVPGARRWYSSDNLMRLAAVLLLGVAIGRFALPRTTTPLPATASATASIDSVAVPQSMQSATSKYLGQTAALLVSLPADARSDRADAIYVNRAHDLLQTTRLLLDSPAAADPRFRTLLEDLELVLAQVVRLQSEKSPSELDLIRQALESRDVLPRLRTAVADISADD
jgi:hypothetical protein